jgi:hypothetical protein
MDVLLQVLAGNRILQMPVLSVATVRRQFRLPAVFPLGYTRCDHFKPPSHFPYYPHPLFSTPLSFIAMFTSLLPTIVALYFLSTTPVRASPCVAFDVQWNLLAFGLDGKDWNAGTQDKWASGASQ